MLRKTVTVSLCWTLIVAIWAGSNHVSAKAEQSVVGIKLEDKVTQPIYSYQNAIRETVYVEAPMDSDNDGKKDRIAVDLMRPKETDKGLKVPVIYEMSPYRAGLQDISFHDVDVELNPVGKKTGAGKGAGAGMLSFATAAKAVRETNRDTPKPFPGYYDNYFVPRGYAVVLAEGPGSGRSEGCPTTGGENEVTGTRAVIDWLNGRAKGYNEKGEPVKADWSTGKVGMIGVSYNGTLPNAVAATGVKGLETIVPIAAISSWYDYYRANGAVVAPGGYQGEDADVLAKAVLTRKNPEACTKAIRDLEQKQDRITGDYNDFWDERNYVKRAKNIRASVFLVHGLNDWNVKTKHAAQWWNALERYHVPRKIWLHQGGHINPFNLRHKEWMTTLNRWFDHWLYGINNGIMKEPMADIEHAADKWETHQNWPDPKTKPVSLHLKATTHDGPGELYSRLIPTRPHHRESLIDDPRQKAEQLAADPEAPSSHRLVYLTPELKEAIRISGTPKITIRARIDKPVANLTALLVDYGTDTRVDYQKGLKNTGEQVCYGEGVPGDTGCTYLYEHQIHTTPFEIVTRGWMDPQNRHSSIRSKPIKPGQDYTFQWDLQADDYLFKPGHRIGVVLISSDHDYTLRPTGGTKITVTPEKSRIVLPIAGGKITFKP